MAPRFPTRSRGASVAKLFYDHLNRRVCTLAQRTVVNGQTRCP